MPGSFMKSYTPVESLNYEEFTPNNQSQTQNVLKQKVRIFITFLIN